MTGLVSPVTGTAAPGDSQHIYVADQRGRIWGINLRGPCPAFGSVVRGKGSVVTSLSDPGIAVFGFAQDSSGELYVLGNKTGVLSGATGTVLRITGPS